VTTGGMFGFHQGCTAADGAFGAPWGTQSGGAGAGIGTGTGSGTAAGAGHPSVGNPAKGLALALDQESEANPATVRASETGQDSGETPAGGLAFAPTVPTLSYQESVGIPAAEFDSAATIPVCASRQTSETTPAPGWATNDVNCFGEVAAI